MENDNLFVCAYAIVQFEVRCDCIAHFLQGSTRVSSYHQKGTISDDNSKIEMSNENIAQSSSNSNSCHNVAQNESHQNPHASIPAAIADVGFQSVYPMNLLNLYCTDMLKRQNEPSPTTTIQAHPCLDQQLDESLRVIDFLLGNPGQAGHYPASSSLLEGAIQIVDQYFSSLATMNHEIDSTLNTSTTSNNKNRRGSNRIDTISRMQSPAGRSLYLVSKGSKSGTKRSVSSTSSVEQDTSSHYLCFLSEEMQMTDSSATNSSPPLSYCSCRSFIERNRTTLSHGTSHRNRSIFLCKHLFAIKLLPVFGTTLGIARKKSESPFCLPTMEFVSEEDYSRAIIQRLIN